MDESTSAFYELRFKTQFLEAKGTAFQNLFVEIMSKVYPADFIPCRPWGSAGDRKNDGYLKSERLLFQVYAPNELRVSRTIAKIREDFTSALPHWREYFDTWVFVHNASSGLPPDVIATLLELEQQHPPIKVTQWGFEELVLRFRQLPLEALRALFGSAPQAGEDVRAKTRRAQELARNGKRREAIEEMTNALKLARAAHDEEEEVEILVGLALLSDRRGHHRQIDYFQQAREKASKLKSGVAKVLYLRAHARACEEQHEEDSAERAYRDALDLCTTNTDDAKHNLATQACVVRSSLAHLLCQRKRPNDAQPIVADCEAYARNHPEEEDGELLQAALEAGIHWCLEAQDHDGALQRIAELENHATTPARAERVGGDLVNVANQASHRNAHVIARAAAEAAVRLGRCCQETAPSFLVGALYTEAMVLLKAGDDATALRKAHALLDVCHGEDEATIKQATQHLIAETRRCAGDAQAAVHLAQQAVSCAHGAPEEIAYYKLALAKALNDNGQTEEALQHASEAWTLTYGTDLPSEAALMFLSDITNYASQLGATDELKEAVRLVRGLPEDHDDVTADKQRALARASANILLRERLLAVLREDQPATAAGTASCTSLQTANARVVEPLLRLWNELPEAITGMYDFWGRGNFGRLLLNTRCFPNTFNITLEVRSLDDVKRAIRLWGLYADFLILLWKGPTSSGLNITPLPGDYDKPGGWGYTICAGDTLRKPGSTKNYYPAVGYICRFPDEIAAFLATEARAFLAAGRLVVVPAVAAGCISPGHGPFEQLLAEAANALPSIRWKGIKGSPIGYVPHSPNAPFDLLADLAEQEAERLRKLRLLLVRRTRELRPDHDLTGGAKMLALEIDDALRDLQDRHSALARKQGLDHTTEPLSGATARFRSTGRQLSTTDSPFAPLLILQTLGYGWRVDGPGPAKLPSRFEPQKDDVIGTWLAPPSSGWTIPTVQEIPLKK
jgi:tetratricopeptide (TPR) repeat protein